jgi:hypothetical protein
MGSKNSKPRPVTPVAIDPETIARQNAEAAERKKRQEKTEKMRDIVSQAEDLISDKIVPTIKTIEHNQSLIRELHPDDYIDVIAKNAKLISDKSELHELLGKFDDLINQLEEWDKKNHEPGRIGTDATTSLADLHKTIRNLLLNRGDNYTGDYYPNRGWERDKRLTIMKQKIDGEVATLNISPEKPKGIKYFAKWVPSGYSGGWLGNEGQDYPSKWVVGRISENLIPMSLSLKSTGSSMTSQDMAPAPSAPPAEEEDDPINVQGGLRSSKTKTHRRRRRSTSGRTSKRLRRRSARASANSRVRSARRL